MDYLKQLPIWVKWKLEHVTKLGDEAIKTTKTTKIPYQINGVKASTINPNTWTSFEKVSQVTEGFSGNGFVIAAKYPLLCIDLDHIIDNNEFKREDCQILVEAANTYTEYSPSKTGLHIILRLEEFFPLIRNKKANEDGTGVEAYTENRYFTFTGESFGIEKPVRTIGKDEAEELLRLIGYPWGEVIEKKVVEQPKQPYLIPSQTLLKKIFKAKGGAKIERIYNGDISDYNNDQSAADAALLTSLAFWTDKNVQQMEEIWLQSPLGQREKTQGRKDYRDRTINAVLPFVTVTYKPEAKKIVNLDIVNPDSVIQPVFLKEIKFYRNPKGVPFVNIPNTVAIFEADSYLANAFRFNKFSELIETNIDNGDDWVPLQPSHETLVTEYIQKVYNHFQAITESTVQSGIIVYSRRNVVNPPVEYITGVVWDEKPRIDSWLSTAFGVEQSPLINAIGSNWMKGLVKRVIEPGCQFDTVLVLEGSQGIGKSSAMRALAEPWYAETILNADQKDFQLVLMQNIVVELSEGATLSRSDSSALKNMITNREDNTRRPYDKSPGRYKRHCVFAMTTNEEQYLKDETGNRRWLPVALPNQPANIEWIIENRAQMFAEAYHRVYTLKETVHEFPEELKKEQESRLESDPWVPAIYEWYFDELTDAEREDGVTTNDAYSKALWNLSRKDFTAGQSARVGTIFRNYLSLKRKQQRDGKVRIWKFFKTPETDRINKDRLESMSELELEKKANRESMKSLNNEYTRF